MPTRSCLTVPRSSLVRSIATARKGRCMRYVFGECVFDTEQYILHRRDRSIPLQPKVFQVLQYLLTHRDRVIAKQELCEQVWPAQFISDATVEGVIKAIRRAVGDDGRTQWCLQTRRGQGYRFVAPLREPAGVSPHAERPEAQRSAASRDEPPQAPMPHASDPSDVSRRQLTVLSCELVGATPLFEQLDPEDLQEVLLAAHTVCEEVITRFDGYTAQYLGDGLLVYFGYPQAHEDDAQRAVWTGLGIIEAITHLNTRLEHDYGVELVVRLGMHTGAVVVGTRGRPGQQDTLAVGATPTIASRLLEVAVPETVVLSAATRRLVGATFDLEDLGLQTLKGLSVPLQIYRVRGASAAASRFEAATAIGLTPLVGREEEIGLLLRRWEHAKDGEGQVMVLGGEPGIGKSRLLQVLCERVVEDPHLCLRYQCSPYSSHSAFYPITVHLERAAQFARDDTSVQKLAKLEVFLAQTTDSVSDVAPLVAALLSIPTDGRYAPLHLSPQRQKAQTIAVLVDQLVGLARHQPVLCIFEDAHWSDPSSLEVLDLLVQRLAAVRVLLVITHRPEFVSPWEGSAHVTAHVLNRLTRQQVRAMVAGVTGGKDLPDVVLDQIAATTDGIPLFVEELTKTVLEAGLLVDEGDAYALAGPVPPLAIPVTLQDALMARLDQLGPVKAVAQVGAVIGRDFTDELVAAVSPWRDEALQDALDQLVKATLLFRRGAPPEATYTFKHALVQAVAYASLLTRQRRQLHAAIAQVVTERFLATVETQPELLAHHYTEAGLYEEAIPYWQRAGQHAGERSAPLEAIAHLTKGLELLMTQPECPERHQQELQLQVALGTQLMTTKGYAAPEVGHAFNRARNLCQHLRGSPNLFPVLRGLWRFYEVGGDLKTARELAEHSLQIAQDANDPAILATAYVMMGITLGFMGEMVSAHMHLEQGMAFYDPVQHRSLAVLYGEDLGVVCLVRVAHTFWMLGYPDQALQRACEALARARELSHPYSLVYAASFTAQLHQLRQEWQALHEQAEAVIALSTEHGFPFGAIVGTALHNTALAMQGQEEVSIAQLEQGIADVCTTGTEITLPWQLTPLAQLYGKRGQLDKGLAVLAKALEIADRHGEGWCVSEIHRLKGELLLTADTPNEHQVEACLHQALDLARRQQAKILELRATRSLCRLWHQQGKTGEARRVLAEIYDWFTEGFETPDLREAQALLTELGE